MNRTLSIVAFSFALFGGRAVADDQHVSIRPDGSALHWSLRLPDTGRAAPLAVLAQGSGCAPALSGQAMHAAATAFAEFAVLTVEKYGVEPNDGPAEPSACSTTFAAQATMSQRIADYAQIIGELHGIAAWDGRLILFGGSEGGLVVARLAAQIHADAAVLLSAAPGIPFGEVVRAAVPAQGQASLEQAFAAARRAPDSLEIWGGYSYRFWADSIDRRVADDMVTTTTPFLVIQGGRDVLPAGGAYAVNGVFASADRTNLTYWEEAGYDHGMLDGDGRSRLAEVLTLAVEWTRQQLD